ncbi:unnamed protein product [Ectocarpus sp. CCAP 1310/34]|nr:unnamed protein product [Ectocarpus sp. CCAP 1310/34]
MLFVEKIFLRGGPLTWVSDSPQRAKPLYCKHPNNSTKLPCPYCKAEQDERLPTCGDLGNARYDVEANRRTWGEAQDGWRELQGLDLAPNEQTKRSAELEIVAPTGVSGGVLGRPLWDKAFVNPARHVPVESLHAYALGAQALVQFFFLALMNEAGRGVISSIVRQGSTLYPPATAPLKDICTNYSP